MASDYSQFQGSDYYHLTKSPKQNNLVDGLNAALQTFIAIRSGKVKIDRENQDRATKEKHLGEDRAMAKERFVMEKEDRQASTNYKRKQAEYYGQARPLTPEQATKVEGETALLRAKIAGLTPGTPEFESLKKRIQANERSANGGAGQGALVKDAITSYNKFIKGVEDYETESEDEFGLPVKKKTQDMDAYIKTPIGNRHAKSVLNNLKQAKASGVELTDDQEELLADFSKRLGVTTGKEGEQPVTDQPATTDKGAVDPLELEPTQIKKPDVIGQFLKGMPIEKEGPRLDQALPQKTKFDQLASKKKAQLDRYISSSDLMGYQDPPKTGKVLSSGAMETPSPISNIAKDAVRGVVAPTLAAIGEGLSATKDAAFTATEMITDLLKGVNPKAAGMTKGTVSSDEAKAIKNIVSDPKRNLAKIEELISLYVKPDGTSDKLTREGVKLLYQARAEALGEQGVSYPAPKGEQFNQPSLRGFTSTLTGESPKTPIKDSFKEKLLGVK